MTKTEREEFKIYMNEFISEEEYHNSISEKLEILLGKPIKTNPLDMRHNESPKIITLEVYATKGVTVCAEIEQIPFMGTSSIRPGFYLVAEEYENIKYMNKLGNKILALHSELKQRRNGW